MRNQIYLGTQLALPKRSTNFLDNNDHTYTSCSVTSSHLQINQNLCFHTQPTGPLFKDQMLYIVHVSPPKYFYFYASPYINHFLSISQNFVIEEVIAYMKMSMTIFWWVHASRVVRKVINHTTLF